MTSFSGSQPMVAEKYKTALVGWWSILCIFDNLYMAMQSLSTYKNANMDDKENNMSFGKNLQYLRQLSKNMTQEALAEKLNVSRQTISKWEMDAANPEMEKALEICKIFNCSLDNLFREEMDKRSDSYSNLRVEEVAGFQYIEHTVISTDPESDAISRMYKIAEENGIENPRVIGWDFPNLSQEQINAFSMHGYTAALVLSDDVKPEGYQIKEQSAHKYVAIHIERPFDNPFVTIPGAYHTLFDFMRTNGLEQVENDVIPCFETDGENMELYIACR